MNYLMNHLTQRNRLDPSIWMTIPEMAKQMVFPDTGKPLQAGDVGILLKQLGLRRECGWKNKYKEPTPKALAEDYAVEIQGRDEDPKLWRWNYPKIKRLIAAMDQLDLPSDRAAWTEIDRVMLKLAV